MKGMIKATVLSVLAAMAVSAAPVRAENTSWDVERNFNLVSGESRTMYLDGWHYVDTLWVRAKANDCCTNARVRVWADGEYLREVYVGANMQTTEFAISRSVRRIQIQAMDRGVWVEGVRASGRMLNDPHFDDNYYDCPSCTDYPARNEAAALSREAINLTDQIERHVNYSDYGTYILPIKKAGARAYSLAQARGSLSTTVRESIITLISQIKCAADFIDTSYEIDALFDLVVKLRTLQEKLERTLI